MVWARIEKRRRIRRQESDGGAGEKKERKTKAMVVGQWITSMTNCRRENCQERKRNTGLNGGVSYDTSTPHKNGKGCARSIQRGLVLAVQIVL